MTVIRTLNFVELAKTQNVQNADGKLAVELDVSLELRVAKKWTRVYDGDTKVMKILNVFSQEDLDNKVLVGWIRATRPELADYAYHIAEYVAMEDLANQQ